MIDAFLFLDSYLIKLGDILKSNPTGMFFLFFFENQAQEEHGKGDDFAVKYYVFLLFRSAIISSAAESCGRKRLRVAGDSEKRTPWWNQEVKEAIRAKKDAFKAWLQDRSSSDLQSRYTEARKAATSAVKKSKEKSWEEFGRRLDSNYFSANKLFWQTIRRLRGKRSSITYSIKDSDGNILTDENEILSRWREYFEDLLNPVKHRLVTHTK